jgi:hypothetical protein
LLVKQEDSGTKAFEDDLVEFGIAQVVHGLKGISASVGPA